MADITAIAWTDSTFNPWWGCTKVAPGCDNCYAAAAWAERVIAQSRDQGASVFFKQWGGRRADKGGCAIGGVEFKEFPITA